MKKIVLISALAFVGLFAHAQSCDKLIADLKKGTLNGLKPTATQAMVTKKLPCSTGSTEDGSEFNCGGGLFFLKHDFFFYSGRDYIEFRAKFKGKLSIPVLGKLKDDAVKLLKMGKAVRTEQDEEDTYLFFKTRYGCVVLKITDDKVKAVAMHAKPAADVELCL
jgi:hypothetical protein